MLQELPGTFSVVARSDSERPGGRGAGLGEARRCSGESQGQEWGRRQKGRGQRGGLPQCGGCGPGGAGGRPPGGAPAGRGVSASLGLVTGRGRVGEGGCVKPSSASLLGRRLGLAQFSSAEKCEKPASGP